ncbi:MAG: hypothetical protein GEU86_19120 [Actinophytocola sp.]|nr:hypothetical protein [Actinophytocola sp.]
MTSTRASASLLAGLVDDAGLFPPAALSMTDAVRRHREDLAAGEAVLTHRFLCAASRIAELREELDDGDRFRVGLIADADGLAATVAEIEADARLTLAAIEFPLARARRADPVGALTAAQGAVDAVVADDVPLFVEPVELSDVDRLAAAVAADRSPRAVGLKIRCGGASQDLFPAPEALGAAVVTVVERGVVMKATAGLHHAVRYTDPDTGLLHHGYLNLLLAVADAQAGGVAGEVAATLRITDPAVLLHRLAELDDARARAVRNTFASYGSCSTRVPVAEAREMGMLQDEQRQTGATR